MKLVLTASLVSIALWWVFFILWMPSTVHLLATVSFRGNVEITSAYEIRERALSYSTRGGMIGTDVFFTRDEVSHLLDVYKLYLITSRILNFTSVFAWGLLVFAVYTTYDLRPSLQYSARILGVLVVVSLTALLLFPVFFRLFHEVLFPQGNWSFPADSLLISVFPETFWRLMLFVAWILIGIESMLFWVMSTLGDKHVR